MRRHADVTLRLQRISTLLIREGNNGSLYEHVLDDAVDLMSADLGSMQLFHPERGELLVLHTDAEVLQQAAGSAVLAAAASILESIARNLRDAMRRSVCNDGLSSKSADSTGGSSIDGATAS
jgi:hypothetical protein